jgi:mycofactocin precursor
MSAEVTEVTDVAEVGDLPEPAEPAVAVTDLLVEEVSIDGMCGVY